MFELNKGIHYKTGSPEPKFPDDGKLRLFSMRFCPFAARVHLVLNIKRIPYNVAYIDLQDKPEWLTKYSPLGKVPAVLIPGAVDPLIESMVISEYLEEQYPTPALYPKDPLAKARDRVFIERFNTVAVPIIKLFINPSTEVENEAKQVVEFLKFLDQEYTRRGTKFFFGNSHPGMADLMIWPWIEKLPFGTKRIGKTVDIKNYPNLAKWEKLMLEQEAVQLFFVAPEDTETFFDERKKGQAPYNLLAERKLG